MALWPTRLAPHGCSPPWECGVSRVGGQTCYGTAATVHCSAMLASDIRSPAAKAVQAAGSPAAYGPVWQDDDPRPSRPVHVVGRLSAAGVGRYYFSGHLNGQTATECRRCLTDVTVSVSEDVQLLFVEADTEG